jgi:uncharacterized protein
MVIDADAHVEESVETWRYLEPEYYPFRPIPVKFPEDTCFGSHNAAWVIDYKLRLYAANPTIMKAASDKGVPIAVQELNDVPGRLRYLDLLKVDRQVIFPSLWLGCPSENVDLEAALARSYNRFMANQCNQSGGRLRYAAVLPWRRPDLAVQEIREVKGKGSAAGIFVHGIEWDIPLTHPSFRTVYEEAERQDLPITVHTGNGSSPTITRMFEGIPRPEPRTFPFVHPLGKGLVSGPYVRYGFTQFLESDLLEEFPRLRVAFLEAGCEWTVSTVSSLNRKKRAMELLGERVFVGCLPKEDLSYVTGKLGAFREDYLTRGLEDRGDLSDETIEKILATNPQRLYCF